jgi:Holliday junction resolvase
MAQTPEGKVKDKVKRLLKKYGAYYFMPVQSGYGAPTLDILACYRGIFVAIETKAPGKKPTARQELTIKQIKEARGQVYVIDGDTSELEELLERLT